MKRFAAFLTVAFLMGINDTNAQLFDSKKITYSVKAGINAAGYSLTSERKAENKDHGWKLKPLLSFHIGGYAGYALTEAFSLQTGLTLSRKGSLETWSGMDIDNSGEYRYEGSFREKLTYLEIPVNALYKTGDFYVGAGPYIGYALSGKWKERYEEDYGQGDVESSSESGDVKFSGEYAWRKRMDFGINLSAGYLINEKISIGLGYGLGLTNINKTEGVDMSKYAEKNRVVSLSAGYFF